MLVQILEILAVDADIRASHFEGTVYELERCQ